MALKGTRSIDEPERSTCCQRSSGFRGWCSCFELPCRALTLLTGRQEEQLACIYLLSSKILFWGTPPIRKQLRERRPIKQRLRMYIYNYVTSLTRCNLRRLISSPVPPPGKLDEAYASSMIITHSPRYAKTIYSYTELVIISGVSRLSVLQCVWWCTDDRSSESSCRRSMSFAVASRPPPSSTSSPGAAVAGPRSSVLSDAGRRRGPGRHGHDSASTVFNSSTLRSQSPNSRIRKQPERPPRQHDRSPTSGGGSSGVRWWSTWDVSVVPVTLLTALLNARCQRLTVSWTHLQSEPGGYRATARQYKSFVRNVTNPKIQVSRSDDEGEIFTDRSSGRVMQSVCYVCVSVCVRVLNWSKWPPT